MFEFAALDAAEVAAFVAELMPDERLLRTAEAAEDREEAAEEAAEERLLIMLDAPDAALDVATDVAADVAAPDVAVLEAALVTGSGEPGFSRCVQNETRNGNEVRGVGKGTKSRVVGRAKTDAIQIYLANGPHSFLGRRAGE